MSSVTHDLHQYRYTTSVHHPLPWAHVRHVSIPELRHESPDLPLMAHLISGLSDCDLSLKEIREHNDADILQLVEVLQACLQFALWSQSILKEKLLELQSSQVAQRVSAREIDYVEARCRAMEKNLAALTEERDTLSLGTANLRTSIVQLETTVKMQARQLHQERERTSLLLAKLEKAFAERPQTQTTLPVPWQVDPCGALRCPTCGHRQHRPNSHHRRPKSQDSSRKQRAATAIYTQQQEDLTTASSASHDIFSVTATSYTDDSLLNAEGQLVWNENRRQRHSNRNSNIFGGNLDGVFPAPCLDWRTLVRYIIHEEKHTSAWPAHNGADVAPSAAMENAVAPSPVPASALLSTAVSKTALSSDLVLPPEVSDKLQSLFSSFTTAVTGDVGEYARSTVTQTRDFITALTLQQVRELTDEQRKFVKDVLDLLRNAPNPSPPSSAVSAAAAAAPKTASPPPAPFKAAAASSAFFPLSSSPPLAAKDSSKDVSARFTQSLVDYSSASILPTSTAQLNSSPFVKSVDFADKANTRASPTVHSVSPSSSILDAPITRKSEGYDYGSLYRSRDEDNSSSPYRNSQPPSLFNSLAGSLVPDSRVQSGGRQEHQRDSSRVSASGCNNNKNNSRTSLLPAFSPDILRTPTTSAHNTPTNSTIASSTSNKTSAHTNFDPPLGVDMHYSDGGEDDDGQPPDADFRLPTSTLTSSNDSSQSSSDGPRRHDHHSRGGSAGASMSSAAENAAVGGPTSSSKLNLSFHSPPFAKPITTPPVHPALSAKHQQQSSSPLTASATPGGFSLYRMASLQSSTRSDGSGGSTHASSQLLRDTKRELEALLAEDAAAERAKQQQRQC